MLKEFKAFALRGNLLELATAFILGIAFAAVIGAFISGIVMPIIAAVLGEPNFDALTFQLGEGVIAYGTFLTALVNFLLIAFVMFLIIRAVTRLQRPAETEAPALTECTYCKSLVPITATRCSACTSELVSR